MKKLFPAPLLSAALIVMWLVLNRSLSAGQIILAVVFGLLMPILFEPLRPGRPRIRHPLVLARLIMNVGYDVLLSNIEVIRGVLRSEQRPPNSCFVVIPLDLRDTASLAALSTITTVVPGTVWCELARDGSSVMLHVWDLIDEEAFIAHFKERYEAPLLKIFES
ncbi:Na+/H+ antiporter subunit E [Ottowia thiooxydans]|uniref:Na+/H+ antiporter subunit E n=1 Tax=Ottowia thiooxydans TaxID=219182 RepID=UPI0004253BBC|nr:Na+/H+ antiporter subunit E [Ottowia thiooxydans]